MRMIASILKISEQGMSKPYLCNDDRGGIRWCKGNHTGVRSLISEWICAKLAREIGLPIPAFEIFKLDVGLFNEWKLSHGESVPELVTESNQYVFGSLNVENCKDVFNPEEDAAHIDKAVFAKIFHFDELIHNTDRTDFNSNLLVNGNVYVIDHNNAFDPGFDRAVFSGEHILRGYVGEYSPDAVADQVGGLVRHGFLDEVWHEMPEAWIDVGEMVLPLETIRGIILEGCHG